MDNKLKIVNYLGKNLEQSFTMHELSKLVKISYATFYRTIQKMKDLVKMQTVGKSKVISLNIENPAIKSYLIISSDEEKKDFLKKQPIINKISSELKTKDIVVLFGSYAKGNEKESSDMDILIINKDGERTISFSKYELLFKKKINPIFITISEFTQMIKEKEENIGKQVLKKHIILQNPDNFWGYILNG